MNDEEKLRIRERQKNSSRVYRCAWGTCKSDNRYYSKRPSLEKVFFIPFPKPNQDKEKCLRWIKACNRPFQQLNINKIRDIHYVCSLHFEGGFGPSLDHPDPFSADPYVPKTIVRKRPKLREKTKTSQINANKDTVSENDNIIEESNIEIPVLDGINDTQEISAKRFIQENVSSPNIQCSECNHNIELNTKTVTDTARANFVHSVINNDSSCMYYTGLPTVQMLFFIFTWIKPVAEKVKLWRGRNSNNAYGRKRTILTLFEEYLLTLVRIRRGYGLKHIAYLFGTYDSYCSRIFTTWINLLAKCLEQTILWPSQKLVKANLPRAFSAYPRTRVIIDCTEFKIQKPFRPVAQRITWSNYKHSNTAKLLVGIMPSGAFTFVSKVYSGSISDLAIVEKSGFVDKITEGDDVMADRGFNIRHLLLDRKATLNIPAFSHGKRLSSKAVRRSRNIASVRIHVERAIGRMKTFRILGGVIPLRLRFQLNQICVIICALCNIQNRLVD